MADFLNVGAVLQRRLNKLFILKHSHFDKLILFKSHNIKLRPPHLPCYLQNQYFSPAFIQPIVATMQQAYMMNHSTVSCFISGAPLANIVFIHSAFRQRR